MLNDVHVNKMNALLEEIKIIKDEQRDVVATKKVRLMELTKKGMTVEQAKEFVKTKSASLEAMGAQFSDMINKVAREKERHESE